MMSSFTASLLGFLAGVAVASFNHGFDTAKDFRRGWVEYRGAIYLVVPAKVGVAP
ncbi:MAG: hypothetical protein J0J10_26395 [Bosea sp.]|uniref:hypothetical protein n=1 Tax=Bosea sp. (in: a-proteobacteria) TaxID=1871050 RepID=UPI001AC3C019|nr:hypothetical protein [Bosea sp. (in: a-proteobacteria)]MBN9472296.1 hypothetical protein [Bosea sp. (in: a-proteobacteria)]